MWHNFYCCICNIEKRKFKRFYPRFKVFFLPDSFVSDVVSIYYTCDERVQEDEEIQAFIKDVCSFGMQDFDHCGGHYTINVNQLS